MTGMTGEQLHNRLAESTSPYLLQHADNPVAWQPWNEQSLAIARELNRPILLSSGYSSCHWCHVMAHESFEDEETAALMNEHFVNIKLDREERPDIDMVYQTAHSLLTQRRGGWPLTVFLSAHTLQPFFCGTYFPKHARHGLPAFKEILNAVARHYKDENQSVTEVGAEVQKALNEIYTLDRETAPLQKNLSDIALSALTQIADRVNGGFGTAPKFPQPSFLQLLLRHRCDDKAVKLSLNSICERGLYDHVGGGFFRYCVDATWTIPHFEKMLYDNGQLLTTLADARANAPALLGDAHSTTAAIKTAQWLEREMQSPEGAYYCAIDADSPGEGDYYVWSREELGTVVGEDGLQALAHRFNLDGEPNFEGRWHLTIKNTEPPKSVDESVDAKTFDDTVANHLNTLLKHREHRRYPTLDNKCLTAWNALAIKGMAKTARAFNYPPALASAERALEHARSVLWKDGHLLGGVCLGKPHDSVFLTDYAFLIDALIELLQHRWRSEDLAWAIELADQLLKQFEDTALGGYYFTTDKQKTSVQRPVAFYDDALPSGYGVAAGVLLRLGYLCDESRYIDSAQKAIERASSVLNRSPTECATLLFACEEFLTPPTIVIIRADDEIDAWHKAVAQKADAHCLAFIIPRDATQLPGSLANRAPGDKGLAYVCTGTSCLAEPIDSPKLLADTLAGTN